MTVHSVLISTSSWLQTTFCFTATTQNEEDKFRNISNPTYHSPSAKSSKDPVFCTPISCHIQNTPLSRLLSKEIPTTPIALLTGVLEVLASVLFLHSGYSEIFSCFYSPHHQEKPPSLRTTCRTVHHSTINVPFVTVQCECKGQRTEIFSVRRGW